MRVEMPGDNVDHEAQMRDVFRAAAAEIERLRKPITWQDIRLHAGEGKLSAEVVLKAANAVLRNR